MVHHNYYEMRKLALVTQTTNRSSSVIIIIIIVNQAEYFKYRKASELRSWLLYYSLLLLLNHLPQLCLDHFALLVVAINIPRVFDSE